MKNQLLKVSLKYGLILGGITIVYGLINIFIFNQGYLPQWTSNLIGIMISVLFPLFIVMAHNKYNKKNNNFISFKDAILIGLIVLGIQYITSIFNMLVRWKMNQLPFSYLSEEYGGIELNSISSNLLASLFGLLINIVILFTIITFESQWKIYRKAGKKGWASIVPIYNVIVLIEIVKKPYSWFVLLLIPFINIIFMIWITNLLSKRFGKNEGFTMF